MRARPHTRIAVVLTPGPTETTLARTQGWRASCSVDIATTGEAALTGATVSVYAVTRAGRSFLASGVLSNAGATERPVEVVNKGCDGFEVTIQTTGGQAGKVNAQVTAW